MSNVQAPVLIVGGGLGGLSAALFLSCYDVPYLLIERHKGTSIQPKARGVDGRTMEIYRQFGLQEAIRDAGRPLSKSQGYFTAETLTQRTSESDDRHVPKFIQEMAKLNETLSPSTNERITQDLLERILLKEIQKRGGHIRFNTECLSVSQDNSSVSAKVMDRISEEQYVINAQYLIASDGANSPVRQTLGISMSGHGTISHQLNIYFQADLSEFIKGREFSFCNLTHPDASGSLFAINNSDRWVFHMNYDPTKSESPSDYSWERYIEIVRTAIGIPDLDVKILSVSPWEAKALVADQFQQDLIFLAGDAAHIMPPSGGSGGSTAIQDVHNLVWKLTYILKGEAHPKLLMTYETERRPVALYNVEMSHQVAKMGMVSIFPERKQDDSGPAKKMSNSFHYAYHSPAIMAEQKTDEEPQLFHELDGSPGTRVPHIWLQKGGVRLSTIDLFKKKLILFTGKQSGHWHEAGLVLATNGHPLQVYKIGKDLIEVDQKWHKAFGVAESGAVLARPDGFISWRAMSEQKTADYHRALELIWKKVTMMEGEGL